MKQRSPDGVLESYIYDIEQYSLGIYEDTDLNEIKIKYLQYIAKDTPTCAVIRCCYKRKPKRPGNNIKIIR